MVNITPNYVKINDYEKILTISANNINILIKNKSLIISGEDMYISFISEDEIILKGVIKEVKINESL